MMLLAKLKQLARIFPARTCFPDKGKRSTARVGGNWDSLKLMMMMGLGPFHSKFLSEWKQGNVIKENPSGILYFVFGASIDVVYHFDTHGTETCGKADCLTPTTKKNRKGKKLGFGEKNDLRIGDRVKEPVLRFLDIYFYRQDKEPYFYMCNAPPPRPDPSRVVSGGIKYTFSLISSTNGSKGKKTTNGLLIFPVYRQ